MIGCDKCEEWYHFQCVGIDSSLITDFDSYEFTCPKCLAKMEEDKKKRPLGGKKSATPSVSKGDLNKRTMKAVSK